MKDILNMSHVASVGVIAIQDAKTNEIVGKIISQFNDSGTATTKVYIHSGALANLELTQKSCGGSGYNKLNSNLMSIFCDHFEYQDCKELEAGSLNAFFNRHGYSVFTLL